jgi:hypothetical protein
MLLALYFLVTLLRCDVDAADLSMLRSNQTGIWLAAVSRIIDASNSGRIELVDLTRRADIPLFVDQMLSTETDRYIFKQDVHQRVNWYLSENRWNPSKKVSFYDRCRGSITAATPEESLAGIYVYTNKEMSNSIGIITVSMTQSFEWYNHTERYVLNDRSILSTGTKLILAFETLVYYNSNSDILSLNVKIDDYVRQANIHVDTHHENDIQRFLTMDNVSCRRHRLIVFDELRATVFSCTSDVIFHCPLQAGSSCWLEEKRFANIGFNIGPMRLTSKRTITVRIDA